MTNKYLLLVVVIVSGVMAVYGVYSYYTIGNSPYYVNSKYSNSRYHRHISSQAGYEDLHNT